MDQVAGGRTYGKSFFEVYNPWQTAGAALGGGLGAGLNLGVGRALGVAAQDTMTCAEPLRKTVAHALSGAAGGLAGDGILQGIEMARDPQAQWSWGRFAQAGAIVGRSSIQLSKRARPEPSA